VVPRTFVTSDGDLEVIIRFRALQIVRLDAIIPASDNPAVLAIRDQVQAPVSQSLGQTLLEVYSDQTLLRAGQRIDQRALQAVHVNFP